MVYYRNKTFIGTRPLYFPDKHFVAIAYKKVVEVHDYQHVVIWKLEHTSNVVSLELCLDSPHKFFIAYSNGNIKSCDIQTFSVTDVMMLGAPLKKIFVLQNGILAAHIDGIYNYPNFDLSLKSLVLLKSTLAITDIDVKTGLMATVEQKKLMIKTLSGDISKFVSMTQWKREQYFSCVACQPGTYNVATGDSSGMIILWWNVNNGFKQFSIYHWHFLELNSIEFNCLGTHLLTGGKEGVFVKWEISVHDSEKSKRFYPRLESPIDSIRSCHGDSGEYYLVTLADNSYHVISTNLSLQNSYYNLIQRPKFLHDKIAKKSRLNPVGLISCHAMPERLKHSVMCNGHEGKLQFFDLISNSVTYQLDVAKQNWPTETENSYIPGFVQVQRAAVSHCGNYIATSEQLGVTNNVYDQMRNTRLFHWSTEEEKFIQQSIIPMDFTDLVVDIIFHPSKSEHVIMITKSNKLFLVSRSKRGEHIRWDIVHSFDLAEILSRFNVHLGHQKYHHNATLCTVTCSHNESDAVLAIGSNSSLTLYLWSHLLQFRTHPLIAQSITAMVTKMDLDNKTRHRLSCDIVSLAMVGSGKETNRYRIACGLHVGLMIVEVSVARDGGLGMQQVSAAVGDRDGPCLVVADGPQVAAMFVNNGSMSHFDIWDDYGGAAVYTPVPALNHVGWAKNGAGEWVVAGLVHTHGHSMDVVTCEEPPPVCAVCVRSVHNNEEKEGGINGLADVEHTGQVVGTKIRNHTLNADDKTIQELSLYDNLNMTDTLKSLYSQ